jgi:hypothetical protein
MPNLKSKITNSRKETASRLKIKNKLNIRIRKKETAANQNKIIKLT